MISPQALLRVLVSRALPSANPDSVNSDIGVRGGRYGELAALSYVRKAHLLADEGIYGVLNSTQGTGITGQSTTSYDATKPSLLLVNTDAAGGKRLYLDYIHLLNTGTAYSNASSNTAIYWSVGVDTINRYSSAGNALTLTNPNSDMAITLPVLGYAGAIVSATASAFRVVVPQRMLRAPVSATALTLANVDEFHLNFGGVEAQETNKIQASATLEATMVSKTFAGPPVIAGPGHSILFNLNCVAGGAVTPGTLIYRKIKNPFQERKRLDGI